MRRLLFLLLPIVLAATVTGCKINSINYFPPHPAQVRIMNLIPGVGAVDVAVGGTITWSAVATQAGTGYQNLDNTTQTFAVTLAGSTTALMQSTFVLAGDVPYTLVLSGTPSQPRMSLLQETTSLPSNNTVLINAFNAAANNNAIDLYVTAPGVDIGTVGPNYFSLINNGGTFTISFPAGTYQFRAAPSGTKTVIYDSGPVAINPNISVSFVAYAVGSSVLVNAAMMQSQGPISLQNTLLAQVKTVHAAPSTAPVDLLQGGVPVLRNVAYNGFGGYIGVPQGAGQVMSFVPTGVTAPTLAQVSATLSPATDQTVLLTGFPGALQAVAFPDFNVTAPPGGVRVRFVNASPDAGPVNVTLTPTPGTSPLVTGLAFPTASGYNNLAEGTYAIAVTDTATGATLLSLPALTFTNPQTSTLYLLGPAAALTGLVAQDF